MRKICCTCLLILLLLVCLAGCDRNSDEDYYVNLDPSWMAYVNQDVPYLCDRRGPDSEAAKTYCSKVDERMEANRAAWEAKKEHNSFWTSEEKMYIFREFFTASHWNGDFFASQIEGWRNVFYPVIFKDDNGIFVLGIGDDGNVRAFWKEDNVIAECNWNIQVHYPGPEEDIVYSAADYTMIYDKGNGVLNIWHFGEVYETYIVSTQAVMVEYNEGENGKHLNFISAEGEIVQQIPIYALLSLYRQQVD